MEKRKKNLILLACFLMLAMIVNAQAPGQPVINTTPKDPSKKITDAVYNLPTTTRADWVEIYTQTNFRGRVARYADNIPNFTYPIVYSNKRGISLKVAPGYIAYISFNEDNSQESIFVGDHPNFGSSNPNDIKSIRVVLGTTAYVNFCGFSTQIHNNDCKRIFGTIKIRILETMASGLSIACPRTGFLGGGVGHNRGVYGSANMFTKENNYPQKGPLTIANLMMGRNTPEPDTYVMNYDGTAVPTMPNTLVLPEGSSAGYAFTVSEAALRENRIKIEFVSDLGVHHKANDLATDFSSNVKMQTPVTTTLDYLTLPNIFSIGDFELKGNPNNNYGAASGVRFSIIKKLRVHFNKNRTPARR